MDPKRQNQPTQENNQRIETKLAQKKKKIEETLWASRVKTRSIKGYDLQKCARRHRHIKRCWVCGSKTHLKRDCPILEKNKLKSRVFELERQVADLVEALHEQLKNKNRREKRKKKKKFKKKQRKHQKMAEAQNVAVRLKSLLQKEEETWNGIFVLKASNILQKLPSKAQSKVKKAYKELYTRDLTEDIVNGFTEGDEFYEQYEDVYGEASPTATNHQQMLQGRIDHIINIINSK